MNPIVGLVFTIILATVAIVSTIQLIRSKRRKVRLQEQQVQEEPKEN